MLQKGVYGETIKQYYQTQETGYNDFSDDCSRLHFAKQACQRQLQYGGLPANQCTIHESAADHGR
jgi:hypothetical protein